MAMFVENFHKSLFCGLFYAAWTLKWGNSLFRCVIWQKCVSIKIVTSNKPIILDLTLWLNLLSIM